MLAIIATNHQFIAINKPGGLPVQSDKTGDLSLQEMAERYCRHPLHLVNRLDRPATGVVVFAKSTAAMTALSLQFAGRQVRKTYLAVVRDAPAAPRGELVHYLKKNEAKNWSAVYPQPVPGGEEAILEYETLGKSASYCLLKINLLTGRHHQIRAQLAAIGCPIKGDVKYGFRRSNPDRSIHLHAWQLALKHPLSGEPTVLEAPLPNEKLWQFFAGLMAK